MLVFIFKFEFDINSAKDMLTKLKYPLSSLLLIKRVIASMKEKYKTAKNRRGLHSPLINGTYQLHLSDVSKTNCNH